MQKKTGSALGAFALVAAFVWIVFDNIALALLFGMLAAAAAGKAAGSSSPPADKH